MVTGLLTEQSKPTTGGRRRSRKGGGGLGGAGLSVREQGRDKLTITSAFRAGITSYSGLGLGHDITHAAPVALGDSDRGAYKAVFAGLLAKVPRAPAAS